MAPVLFPTLFGWAGGPDGPMDISVMDNPNGGAELLGMHCLSSSMGNVCGFTHTALAYRIPPVPAARSIQYLPPQLSRWKAFNMHNPFLRGRGAISADRVSLLVLNQQNTCNGTTLRRDSHLGDQ